MSVVYKLELVKSGHFYIGSTDNLDKRINRHALDLANDRHHNIKFQAVYNKYGGKLIFTVLSTHKNRDLAYKSEDKFIRKFQSNPKLLNIGKSAVGGDNLTRNPNKKIIVDRMTKSINTRYSKMTDEDRSAKYGKPGELNPMWGRTHTKKVRDASSTRAKGNSYALGCIRSQEFCARISAQAKLRVGDKNPFFGRHHSEDTRALMSATRSKKEADNRENGIYSVQARSVLIEGKVFHSVSEAARQLGVCAGTIVYRVRSSSSLFVNYKYLT